MLVIPNKTYEINGMKYSYADKSIEPVYHYHSSYEIFFLCSGEAVYFVNDKSYHLHENDFIFIGRNMIHKPNYMTANYTRCKFYINEGFLDEGIATVLDALCADGAYTPENPSRVKKIITSLEREIADRNALSEIMMKCCMTELIAYCARHDSIYADNDSRNPTIERIVAYVNKSYAEDITLAAVSAKMHMSGVYLSRLFKESTGFTFKEYLKAVRIKHARELLSETALSIKEIAVQCGFSDSNYFSQVFRGETGIIPLGYRKSE